MPLRDAVGRISGAVAVGRDVTQERRVQAERQRAEEERRKLLDDLRAALSVRDAFLNLAAHELKTPLTVLWGGSQILLRQGGHTEQERRLLTSIGTQTERMSQLVQRLETALQVESGALVIHREPVDLRNLAEQVAAKLQVGAPRHRITVGGDELAVAEVDRKLVYEVLFGLVENSIKYCPECGPIEVTVLARSGETEVGVRDEGPGIPEENQAKLFERFYQASPMVAPTTGMGLGLYLSREIARRHGGRIWVESAEGRGTTVRLVLPSA